MELKSVGSHSSYTRSQADEDLATKQDCKVSLLTRCRVTESDTGSGPGLWPQHEFNQWGRQQVANRPHSTSFYQLIENQVTEAAPNICP